MRSLLPWKWDDSYYFLMNGVPSVKELKRFLSELASFDPDRLH